MRDPFFIAPIPWLVDWARPWCDRLNLPSLPLHIHEVLAAALLYGVIFWPVSPLISNLLAPQHYAKLPRKKRLNWDAHVVSMIQSTLINVLAIWVMVVDDERRNMDWEERVWGYTGAAGMVQALAAGYFVWDLVVTSLNLDVFGLGTLAHAIAALLVYSLGFRPFVNYYGCIFILWELSTPFLNVHWFMDKVNMTGSRAQLYNGFLLLFSFFSCRLVYGTYQSALAFRDIWAAVNGHPSHGVHGSAVMTFATDKSTVPLWLAAVYLASNLTLNGLNFYWFVMMISAVRKRFEPGKQPQTEVEVDLSTFASGMSAGPKPQRRKV
ncbi:TLC domain-containing protein [Tolypocladium capitatum]|uniref:TLC domain-containing protein n=1 Tax=Tolypocladium capitatum TaxID=45235 RepID=A0A2K3QP29_9HYPO|nr:TLC domain-containing protein [Tolypocladium capitatum]